MLGQGRGLLYGTYEGIMGGGRPPGAGLPGGGGAAPPGLPGTVGAGRPPVRWQGVTHHYHTTPKSLIAPCPYPEEQGAAAEPSAASAAASLRYSSCYWGAPAPCGCWRARCWAGRRRKPGRSWRAPGRSSSCRSSRSWWPTGRTWGPSHRPTWSHSRSR